MRATKKWIAAFLALAMMVPLTVTLVPLPVKAEASESIAYAESFDFDDALEDRTVRDGVLSTAYVEGKLKSNNFSAVRKGDGFYPSDNDRVPEAWKVVKDEETGRIYIDQRTKSEFSKTGDASLFTLRDAGGWICKYPYQISFDFRPELCKSTASLVHVTSNNFLTADEREGLINVKGNQDTTYISVNSNGTTFALTNGEWYRILIRVEPAVKGAVTLTVEDENGNLLGTESKTSSKLRKFAALETVPASAISIGYIWSSTISQLFALDNIKLSVPMVDEKQDFEDTHDTAVSYIKTQINDKAKTAFTAYNFKTNDTNPYKNYLSVVTDEDGNKYLREYIPKEASNEYGTKGDGKVENGGDGKNYHFEAGIYYGNQNLFREKFEVSVRYKHDAITNGSFNAIRFQDNTSTKMAPLVIYGGGRVTTTSNWHIVVRKTDAGYQSYTMPKDIWHTYRMVVDPATSEYELFMTVGDGEEERLYFLKTAKRADTGTNWTTVYTEDQVKTTACFIDYGSAYDMSTWTSTRLWLMHGTSNFVNTNNSHDFHVDDISLKTLNSNTVQEFFNFENYAPYTFNWNHDMQVVNSNSNSAPVTDWEVANDPKGTRGQVLHTATKDGRTSSIFSIRDINNGLIYHEFDISFDLYFPKAPNNSVNTLKIYTSYNDSTGKYNTAKFFTPFVINGYLDVMYGTSDTNVGTSVAKKLTTGTWYTLRARINPVTGTYSTYVNDQLLQTNKIDDIYPGKDMMSALNKMQIEICSQWSVLSGQGPTAEYYLDNVRIETVIPTVQDGESETVESYDLLITDFEDDGKWLADAKNGSFDMLTFGYSSAKIIENAGIAGNHALDLSGSAGSAMNLLLPDASTFTVAASLCYEDTFGSSLNFVTLFDPALAGGESTLLSIKGQTAGDEYNGALYFVQNQIVYYICDASGKQLSVSAPHAETARFTDVALVIDTAAGEYSVYVNGAPAYYKLDGKVTYATGISLGMTEGKKALENPELSFLKCSQISSSKPRLYIDDICVSKVDNGLTPLLAGYQENHSVAGAIRFLATVDTLYYQSLGFEVTANGETKNVSGNTVYTSVIANGETHEAADFNGRYITALIVTDIDEAGVSFEVRPFVTFFGKTIYGKAETIVFNGAALVPAAN